ncbi:aaa family ATPase [Ophiostoma piceae UAMH 11346]|uniref:Aaa family ATPase n=1 Tax=Ophiostoma piceae (strain UAMH 11346) TaxID=1262450 RepID=S3BWT5_OPHP1|nr:aaa family ATPase [Ophiostoma piceae UAMH 11346]
MQPLSGRAGKLATVFRDIIYGKRTVTSSGDAKLFLEAVTTHPDYASPAACLQAVFASPARGAGAEAVQTSLRADFSHAFIKTYTLPFVRMLANAAVELQVIAEGQLLKQLVQWILDQPMLWERLVPMFCEDELSDEKGESFAFAWIVHERLVAGGKNEDDEELLLDSVNTILESGKFADSADIETRTLGHKIEKLLKAKMASRDGTGPEGVAVGDYSPGGRHDNDFVSIREIKIYPTNDELMSEARPFYRRTDEIFNNATLDDPDVRAYVHIDNQFRLLREDMLAEIREDLKGLNLNRNKRSMSTQTKQKRKMVIGGLTPLDLDLGNERRGKEATLSLSCAIGLEELRRQPGIKARKVFLEKHKNYLKHQAVGVFIREVQPSKDGEGETATKDSATGTDEIIAFACVDRNVDALAGVHTQYNSDPESQLPTAKDPVVSVRFADSQALGRVLIFLRDDTTEPTVASAGAPPQGPSSRHRSRQNQGSKPVATERPKKKHNVRFVVIGTAVFSYEHVLGQLKNMDDLALDRHIVCPRLATKEKESQSDDVHNAEPAYSELHGNGASLSESDDSGINLTTPAFHPAQKLQKLVDEMLIESETTGYYINNFRMEPPQIGSLVSGLTQPLTVIQGPPGTGKSFIGAQIARFMVKHTNRLKVLVITYTNHALDQFLDDLKKAGIHQNDMVRLGVKSTVSTQDMLLSKQVNSYKFTPSVSQTVSQLKEKRSKLRVSIQNAFDRFQHSASSESGLLPFDDIMQHLEFSEDDSDFFEAFQVPELPGGEAGWAQVGHNNRALRPDHFFKNWRTGKGPGLANYQIPPEHRRVWQMGLAQRRTYLAKWSAQIVKEQVKDIEMLVSGYDNCQQSIDRLFKQGETTTLKSKRIIACTTTAAAKYHHMIHAAKPDVVLVEEAGEILESHVLTSLASPSVKQLILIGDHQQLRPRYNNYALTVEKGEGYNFNMSMFERLITQGCPFITLQRQHRMHQDISIIPRALTYPNLLDGPGTGDDTRRPLLGVRDRLIFMNHEYPEFQNENGAADRFDPEAKTTKSNPFEAEMCLKVVRYLAQQGYGTADMVILTPYVGQLRLLMDLLATEGETDPVLNDLDTATLMQAGLMTDAEAKASRGQLRVSTIDNYQGEESDIVIGCLTRSNERGDIGFMAAPERLNVLCTRARECLILIGNMTTFKNSYTDKGKATWTPFFDLLNKTGHLYDGIPVRCERHPDIADRLLKQPEDFDVHCPDGGCAKTCGAKLSCGAHVCQRRCHPIADHSRVGCKELVSVTCDRGHTHDVACSNTSTTAQTRNACSECAKQDRDNERQIQRNLKLEKDRLERQAAYAKALQEIDDECAHERRLAKYHAEEETEKQALAQKKQDLKALRAQTDRLNEKKKAEAAKEEKKKENKAQYAGDGDYLPGSAREDWEYSKRFEGASSDVLDNLMQMTGLEEVKLKFLSIKNTVDTAIRQGLPVDSKHQRYGCALLGNPGTGKTTVARLLSEFLASMGVIPGNKFIETTGAKLANEGVSSCQTMVDDVLNAGGGVVFIDEAYQMTSGNNHGGGAVLDYLLAEVENLTGKIVFLLAGYDKEMEPFFAHNPGLQSRFPEELRFSDYADDELLQILKSNIEKRYDGAMKWDVGPEDVAKDTAKDGGLYMRVVARRIGRGRGKPGFGNARAVQNVVAQILKRQANRLRKERRSKKKPDDFLLTKEDLIGPEPGEALAKSAGWTKLNKLIGANSVKQSVRALVDSISQNYHRELAEEATIEYSVNKVFLGNPGTGKTTVAKLYGQILGDIGLLSNGEVVVRNPSDFVGSALGESEKKTKGILAASVGKILVIDEAYGLYGGDANGIGGGADIYKTAVIDTIVAEVQSVPGDDRCVLLLGYTEQLEAMFQNVNPGLARRFPIASGFVFDDFSQAELGQILDMKLAQQSYTATDKAKLVALEVLSRARNRPNFGNAGEVDILLDAAKTHHQVRLSKERAADRDANKPSVKRDSVLRPEDFDANFARADAGNDTNVSKLFEGTVGAEEIITRLEGYQHTVRTMRSLGLDAADIKESVPFNFIFRGPPGTGKTTTARRMGKVFYDMGFLATAKVTECSASELVGQYVGHTAKKVVQMLDKALGQVLFIDEAYRLDDDRFGKEAIDEIVDCATKEKYQRKMIIIMAGYEADMNRLLSANEGLTSRFTESINFHHLPPSDCVLLLQKTLEGRKKALEARGVSVDISVLDEAAFSAEITDVFGQLMAQASWANSRDVKTLGTSMGTEMLKDEQGHATKKLVLSAQTVRDVLGNMLKERGGRQANKGAVPYFNHSELPKTTAIDEMPQTRTAASANTATTQAAAASSKGPDEVPPEAPKEETAPTVKKDDKRQRSLRDAGVSDEVWGQLQKDREAGEQREREYQQLLKERDEASEAARDAIVRRLVEEDRRRKEAEAMQAKLQELGACPVGYEWIKQSEGYRCAGGSHFLSDSQLA